jgi:hypothetical protein
MVVAVAPAVTVVLCRIRRARPVPVVWAVTAVWVAMVATGSLRRPARSVRVPVPVVTRVPVARAVTVLRWAPTDPVVLVVTPVPVVSVVTAVTVSWLRSLVVLPVLVVTRA